MKKTQTQHKIPTSTAPSKVRATKPVTRVVTQVITPTASARPRRSERAIDTVKTKPSRGNPPAATPHPISKQATIAAMLRQRNGTTITELMAATGWQSHSIRAALTGLRKAGHQIERQRETAGATRYLCTAA